MDRVQMAWTLLFVALFTVLGGLIAIAGQSQPPYREGEVLTQSVVARVDFAALNVSETQQNKQRARESVPALYDFNESYFQELRSGFDALIELAADTSIRSAEAEAIDEQAMERLRRFIDEDGHLHAAWTEMVDEFLYGRHDDISRGLAGIPVLSSERINLERKRGINVIRIRHSGGEENRFSNRWVDIADRDELEQRLRNLAVKFPRELQAAAVNVVMRNVKRTYIFNPHDTAQRQRLAEESEPEVFTQYVANQVLVPAGTELTRRHLELMRDEQLAHLTSLTTRDLVALRAGQFGFVALLALGLWMYILSFNERVARNAMRGFAIVALLLLCQAVAVGATQFSPVLLYGTAVFPTLLAATVLSIAYDQRFALAIGAMHVVLVMFSLNLSLGFAMMVLVGIGVALVQLKEVRTRSKLVQVGVYTGMAMAVAGSLTAMAKRPLSVEGEWLRLAADATIVFITAAVVGMFVQAILPIIERVFRVTTAMTLRELNDASHPLLQRLAQAAPGTYQHSLRLADITEAAAEAIGANGLMCRVGAMYHDIGKMNKPMYFIENQGGGPNRHSKLSPAMSVLIIVGHVKDGIEMAREYGLPPVLRHFLESHHGTTLVEYFYNAARQQREADDQPAPTEFEFRYPGPKPQTKEAAILMLGDGVESACRTLAEPTPTRLEQLVHKMAQKRLMDGQFDECNLTLAELHRIEVAFTKTLCAVYHGRVSYPSEAKRAAAEPAAADVAQAPPVDQPHPEPQPARTATAG